MNDAGRAYIYKVSKELSEFIKSNPLFEDEYRKRKEYRNLEERMMRIGIEFGGFDLEIMNHKELEHIAHTTFDECFLKEVKTRLEREAKFMAKFKSRNI